jgi:phage baseplate assembly protein W
MPVSLDVIGRGWAFPLGVNSRGGIALAEGDEEIRQAILLIVRTRLGGRVMRPAFGCRIWELLFAPNNAATWTLAEHHVTEALGMWEPRIEVDAVHAGPDPDDPAMMLVEIEYHLRATHDRRNLVYPFYLIPEEPEAASGGTASVAVVAASAPAALPPGSAPLQIVAGNGATPPTVAATAFPPSSKEAPR